jgi:hypothetical protein
VAAFGPTRFLQRLAGLMILRMFPKPVGAGLPAMAALQPTNLWQMYPVPIVGVSLLAKAFCQALGFFLAEYISIPAATAA